MAPIASAAPWRAAPPWHGAPRCASLPLKPERRLARYAMPDAQLVGGSAAIVSQLRRGWRSASKRALPARDVGTALLWGSVCPAPCGVQEHTGRTAWWLGRLAAPLTASHTSAARRMPPLRPGPASGVPTGVLLRAAGWPPPTHLLVLTPQAHAVHAEEGQAGGQRSAGNTAEAVLPRSLARAAARAGRRPHGFCRRRMRKDE
jgi:hypothetical protein